MPACPNSMLYDSASTMSVPSCVRKVSEALLSKTSGARISTATLATHSSARAGEKLRRAVRGMVCADNVADISGLPRAHEALGPEHQHQHQQHEGQQRRDLGDAQLEQIVEGRVAGDLAAQAVDDAQQGIVQRDGAGLDQADEQ